MTARKSDMEDYSRPGLAVSRWGRAVLRMGAGVMVVLVCGGMGAVGQYPGRITRPEASAATLRSVAVLEWVGEAGKPAASRLIPVSVYDGEQLNDGGIYLNRPAPIALGGGTEYVLQEGGRGVRLFDVFGASEVFGVWQGFGVVKPLPAAEAAQAAGEKSELGSSGSPGGPGSSGASSAGDADRPTLRRGHKPGEGDGLQGSNLEGSNLEGSNPDGANPDGSNLDRSGLAPDPDRPRLKRGKPADLDTTQGRRLEGMPADLKQAVAVSDAVNRGEHVWGYRWANPDDELRMKLALEAIARTALGMDTLPDAAASDAADSTRKRNSMLHSGSALEALADEDLRVFELGHGAAATLVLTAASPKAVDAADGDAEFESRTAPQADETPVIRRGKPLPTAGAPDAVGRAGGQKFITLIAQPDLYGGVQVLYRSATDVAHLSETPRMRLVDAVDARGDNRGELLFELRGAGERQFALYRVGNGAARQVFVTGGAKGF